MKPQNILTALVTAFSISIFGGVTTAQAALFVTTDTSVRKYDSSTGALINASFISGLPTYNHGGPGSAYRGLAVSGDRLYLSDYDAGTVSIYDVNTGALINGSLITGLNQPYRLAISGTDLFVGQADRVGKFSTAGSVVNANFITGITGDLMVPIGLDVSGGNLYTSSFDGNLTNNVGIYSMSGTLISAFQPPVGGGAPRVITDVSVSGSTLFIPDFSGNFRSYSTTGNLLASGGDGRASSNAGLEVDGQAIYLAEIFSPFGETPFVIGKYDAVTGGVLDPDFVSNLPFVRDFVFAPDVVPVPEPVTLAWGVLGVSGLAFRRRRYGQTVTGQIARRDGDGGVKAVAGEPARVRIFGERAAG